MFTVIYVEQDGSVGYLEFHDEKSAQAAQAFLKDLTKGAVVITEPDDDDE